MIRFIDLFSGMGGIRIGFEQAAAEFGIETKCVFTSDIKQAAQKVFVQNHPNEQLFGDITQVDAKDIPDFDIMLAGYPCQSYSFSGKRLGFEDTRGTLFFEVARILKEKQPFGFVFENVEGLVVHDKQNKKDEIGQTLQTMLDILEDLGYSVSWMGLHKKEKEYILWEQKQEKYLLITLRKKKYY